MCKKGTNWDETLPNELRPKWESWLSEIPKLGDLKIRRCYKPEGFKDLKKVELHHFSDASQTGYGQSSYLRLIDTQDNVHCSLVLGKARVVPLRPITIPRLELQAAVVSIQVSNFLNKELDYQNIENYYWTDSKVVIGYIRNDARRFHIYVANRIQRIKQSSLPEQWHYVRSEDNPADHASRGLGVKGLEKSNWFSGPSFLWETEVPFSNNLDLNVLTDDPELKSTRCLVTTSSATLPVLSRLKHFSDWTRAVTAITALQQYISRKRNQTTITPGEARQKATLTIVKWAQQEVFAEEIDSLKHPTKSVQMKSSLSPLNPYLDDQQVLRVGGRLDRSTMTEQVKHPMILPRKSHVTTLIIRWCHERVAHQGRGITINKLRSSGFWVVNCSAAVTTCIFRCIECRKLRGKANTQRMADLPKDRLEPSPPFTYCGMDCFGPFLIKERRSEVKRYGVIFTCLALRAIHTEVVEEMSTDAFLNCLRSFIAIRGPVRHIRCDRGSNFVGAKNELQHGLQNLDEGKIKDALSKHQCDFVFNSPASSHMGGIWERQIRSVRNVLQGILDLAGTRLNTSSIRTFLYEAMAIVNSRPLTVQNLNDPTGPSPLTPNQLLTMKSDIVLPPPGNFVREDLYARKRWRAVQYLANTFWTRWRKEYLLNLQSRQKWRETKRNIQVGDIVLLKEEDTIRSQWRLAKVTETIHDEDGLVRRVKILMGDPNLSKQGKRISKLTFLERPIHKLVLLVENTDEDSK
ncbi:uncharacterized protein LOC144445377 [Glandiceps talaboti]